MQLGQPLNRQGRGLRHLRPGNLGKGLGVRQRFKQQSPASDLRRPQLRQQSRRWNAAGLQSLRTAPFPSAMALAASAQEQFEHRLPASPACNSRQPPPRQPAENAGDAESFARA